MAYKLYSLSPKHFLALDMTETSDDSNSLAPDRATADDAATVFSAWMQQGDRCVAAGAMDKAKVCYATASKIDKRSAEAYLKLGIAHYHLDENAEAIEALSTGAKVAPNSPEILNTLGAAYGRSGRTADSISAFQQVFQLDPTQATAAMNCGRLLLNTGQTLEGEAWLARAANLRPDHSETLRLLTEARLALGQPRLALLVGEKAVRADPTNFEAKLALAQAYLSTRKLEPARDLFTAYLAHNPHHPQALYFLAETEEKRGQTNAAKYLYERVLTLDIDPEFRTILRLKLALASPVINVSTRSIDAERSRLAANLRSLIREPVKDPYQSGGFTNFYLAYQALDDRAIQTNIARFYLDCCPALGTLAPHIGSASSQLKKKVAILSSFLRQHTVGYLCRGLIQYLDRERFEVVLLRAPILPIEDPVAPVLADMADQVIDLPDDLDAARSIAADVGADLIYFPEIGMEDIVYFLAFSRLAPVQVMGWGHPVTSGIPNMDAFLSVADMEPENSAEHYSEALIKLNGLSICVPEPDSPDTALSRITFGMDETAPAYLCAQSLFKIHPDFDAVVAKLQGKDPAGMIYFMSLTPEVDRIFSNRLKGTEDIDMDRIRILKRVPSAQFTTLLKSADVLLDIPHWSGGKTSLESLYAGTPIVHWPGDFMRGRHTLVFYKHMGVMDCVVDSAEAYVDTAYRLIHDDAFRISVRQRIAETARTLFNDTSAIDEISDVFDQLIERSRQA